MSEQAGSLASWPAVKPPVNHAHTHTIFVVFSSVWAAVATGIVGILCSHISEFDECFYFVPFWIALAFWRSLLSSSLSSSASSIVHSAGQMENIWWWIPRITPPNGNKIEQYESNIVAILEFDSRMPIFTMFLRHFLLHFHSILFHLQLRDFIMTVLITFPRKSSLIDGYFLEIRKENNNNK